MNELKKWAEANGLSEVYQNYENDCEAIAEECAAEGYPDHGSNYELRVARLEQFYPELFGEEE